MSIAGFGPRVKTLVIATFMVLCGFLMVIPMDELTVEGADVPSTYSGNWIVSGVESYDGGTCVLTGSLIIQSGGNLTLDNVTIAINNAANGQYYVQLNNGGILTLKNSTIKSNTAFRSSRFQTNGALFVEDSTIQDFGPQDWWEGVNIWQGTAKFYRSTIKNTDMGLYISGASLTVVDCTFTNNYQGAIIMDSTSPTIRGSTFTNNGNAGAAGWMGTITSWWGAYAELYDCVISDNNGDGLYLEEASIKLYNVTIKNNSPNDIVMNSWGSETVVDAYNTTFSKVSIDPWGGGGTSKINVHWWLNISATWESDGSPVADADLDILNKDDLEVLVDSLNEDGEIWYLEIKEYEKKANGQTTYTPHKVNVTGSKAGKERYNETSVTIDESMTLDFVLDDVPPDLTITSPPEGLATNSTKVTVTGMTDIGSRIWVNNVLASVGFDGSYSFEQDLKTEGLNNIFVKAQDLVGNERTAQVNVTRDTIKPQLTIDSPIMDSLFNYTAIEVRGSTEVTANLTVNEIPVTVGSDGKYATTLELVEGENTITAHSVDPVGNQNWASVKVDIDLTPPILTIVSPIEGQATREASIQVTGATELKAVVTVNGNPTILSGSRFQSSLGLKEGVNLITVRSCDIAKNCVERSVNVTMDSIPPVLDVTYPPTMDEVLTNEEEITITGTTEPGAKVTVGGKNADVEEDGSWSKLMRLNEGVNTFTIRAEDALGNPTQTSRKITRDSIAPNLEITSPDDGFKTKEVQIRIEGIVEAGAELTMGGVKVIYSGSTFERIVNLDKDGATTFRFEAKDEAGNTKTASITIIRDTVVNLTVNEPLDGLETEEENITVKGTADLDGTVYVDDDVVDVDKYGRFETEIAVELGETEITVLVVDDIGNEKEVVLTVTRVKKPDPPRPGPHIEGGGGNMLWAIIALVVVIAVIATVAIMLKRRKKEDPPPAAETAPEPLAPPPPVMGQQQQFGQQPPQAPPPQQWGPPPPQQPAYDPYGQQGPGAVQPPRGPGGRIIPPPRRVPPPPPPSY